jgi:hypothetical protein
MSSDYYGAMAGELADRCQTCGRHPSEGSEPCTGCADLNLAAKILEIHQVEFISYEVGWVCGCDDRGVLAPMPFLSDALRHQAAEILTAVGARYSQERRD